MPTVYKAQRFSGTWTTKNPAVSASSPRRRTSNDLKIGVQNGIQCAQLHVIRKIVIEIPQL